MASIHFELGKVMSCWRYPIPYTCIHKAIGINSYQFLESIYTKHGTFKKKQRQQPPLLLTTSFIKTAHLPLGCAHFNLVALPLLTSGVAPLKKGEIHHHTVDGRYPAPVEVGSFFMCFHYLHDFIWILNIPGGAGFLALTVSFRDFVRINR